MTKLFPALFENRQVRIIDGEGGFWFVAKDVAKILGYHNTAEAIRDHCKGVSEMLIPTKGGRQMVKIIPEKDLYRLIMRSKKEEAEQFEEWVCGEVLPSIRKTGRYEINRHPKEQLCLPLVQIHTKHIVSEELRLQTAMELAKLATELLKYKA